MKKRELASRGTVRRLCVLLCLFVASTLSAQVEFLEESTVTTEGLYFYYADGSKAWYYNPNISPRGDCFTVVNGYIFFSWYKGGMTNRKLMISRKKIGSGNWVSVEFPYRNTFIANTNWGDSHRTISVGVSKIDGTVHIFYDHHNDPLKYVVSKKHIAFAPDSEFTLGNFEATRGWLAEGEPIQITYPKITQNDDGDVMLNYRVGAAVGGDEKVHVYNGVEWTKSKLITKGRLGDVALNNYAYGNPDYNNGDVYYAFSVRWASKYDDGVLNEGVYLAKCGPTFTDKWEDPEGNLHSLPIDDFSPFLIDLPASNADLGSSGGPGLVVSEDGDVHITYDGRGTGNTYEYTYTRKAGESTFTKHQGVRKTGLAWNNRFYTINASGGTITITSGEPGSVNYRTELVHSTGRSFGVNGSYIDDGKLVLIVSENKQADKKEIYCYVFQLPVPAPVVQDIDYGDWDVASTWDPDGIPASSNDCTTAMNLYVNNAANPFGGASLTVLPGGQLHLRDSVNTFVVDNLIMKGGQVYAGTGNNNTFTLDGTVSVVSNTVFQGVGDASGPRNLNILSQISGTAAITSRASDNSSTHTLSIGNAANSFSGTWISQNGTLAFASAGAAGKADIQVLDHGALTIAGDWSTGATLTVADTATVSVDLGSYNWTVSGLVMGGVAVDYGTYSVAALNALGSNPVFAGSGTISVVDPTIVTMDVLNSPETWSTGGIWDNDQVPAAGFDYYVPGTGNLKSPDGNSTFAGDSLTIEGGGKFQFRAKHELGERTTVNGLVVTGGTSGSPVNLAAGTGNNTINHLGGSLHNDGFSLLSGYGNSTGPRNIRISSLISGNGTLHSTGSAGYPHTCTIANAANTFAGVWQSKIGTLAFENADAVGMADIEVLDTGSLKITDDWSAQGTLTVADTATAQVDLGSYNWSVSSLVIGGSAVAEGRYLVSELNALGNAVFTGSGSIYVGTPPAYELIAGWERWSTGTSPATILSGGIDATASAGDFSSSKWAASTDGTFGSLTTPAAIADNAAIEDGLRVTGGTSISVDVTIENTSTSDLELETFRFDALRKKNEAGPDQWMLAVLSGSISTGEVESGTLAYVASGSDLADHDVSLVALADNTVEAGSSVTFRLSFTGGTAGHDGFTDVDNIALTGAFSTASPVEAPEFGYSMNGGDMVFSWTGTGFKVQARTNLTEGSWQDVPGGDTAPVNISPTGRTVFFRLIEQ